MEAECFCVRVLQTFIKRCQSPQSIRPLSRHDLVLGSPRSPSRQWIRCKHEHDGGITLYSCMKAVHVHVHVSATCDYRSCQVWDAALGQAVAVRRWGGGGVSLVEFSPDGRNLFAATPSTLFR